MELPSILLVTLTKQPSFTTDYASTLSSLHTEATVLESETANDALRLLASSNNINTVLISDPGILSTAHAWFGTILAIFVRAGATLILCNCFAIAAYDPNARNLFKDFMSKNFGLEWELAAAKESSLSPQKLVFNNSCLAPIPVMPMKTKSPELPSQYFAKSIGLTGVKAANNIYHFAEKQNGWLDQAAVAMEPVGRGRVGWMGHQFSEGDRTLAIFMRLCGLESSEKNVKQDDSKFSHRRGNPGKRKKKKANEVRARQLSTQSRCPAIRSQTKDLQISRANGKAPDSLRKASDAMATRVPDVLGGLKSKNLGAKAQRFTDEIEAAYQRQVDSLSEHDEPRVADCERNLTGDVSKNAVGGPAQVLDTVTKNGAAKERALLLSGQNADHTLTPLMVGPVLQVPIRQKRNADEMDMEFVGGLGFRKRQRVRNARLLGKEAPVGTADEQQH